jgi:ParD-like antitoxin of type II bacterial toxin-antitoxin system
MAKGIRVSDDLYMLALAESRLMNRSLAQQLEHWAKLGKSFEESGASLDDVRAASVAYRHSQLARDVKEGRRAANSLLVIPMASIKRAELTFPAGAFDNGKTSW